MDVKTRYDEMEDAAWAFNVQYPNVYTLFHRFTMEKIHAGFENYSVNGMFERIRWETATGTKGSDMFKINNSYRPFYARWWMERNPQYNGFFRTRHQISKETPAIHRAELGPLDFPYEPLEIPFNIEDFL